ncbi:MAG TPA: ATP-dependent Clp protease proteolytic subunit [Tepidisphaeraceae bacterium]|jgi:ATP-dependent Clp protease protease subunit|nr:ATP-dependent Clp protease proteolytic subunit [Tepidisphaeraceae bacterium]
MNEFNPRNVDPRLLTRAAEFLGTNPKEIGTGNPRLTPGYLPQAMPQAMPGPAGPGMNRYREMTLEEMLLENRVVFLVGEINHVTASRVIMQMLYLQSVKRDQDINFYINSPGGVVDDTLAMYDIMRFLQCEIATYCIGRAESGGAVVFMAGKKGKRYILPNAKVMIHQPFGGVYGQASDIEIQAEEILKTKEVLNRIMSKCTGQPVERIQEDSERDRFFDAKQAVAYGICDEILGEEASEQAVAAADATKPK